MPFSIRIKHNQEEGSKASSKLKFVYIGKGQDKDLIGLDLRGKIAVMDRIIQRS